MSANDDIAPMRHCYKNIHLQCDAIIKGYVLPIYPQPLPHISSVIPWIRGLFFREFKGLTYVLLLSS